MVIDLSPKAAEIVACARTLLASGGYNGFSYADISERVRISKPSIHHHFASKAELVHTVVKLYRQETRAGLQALDAIADPVKRLRPTPATGQHASVMGRRPSASAPCSQPR